MKKKLSPTYQLKLFFLGFWILFTSAMVVWWWFYGLSENTMLAASPQLQIKHNRMLMWEGLTFLSAIFTGGFFLWKFMRQDIIRHNQLKIFFSNFSHDIKTSITRLRLQSEVLQEEKSHLNDGKLKQLLEDIARLDLQLENSLYVAQENDYQIFSEKMQLSELIRNIKSDFSEIDIFLEKDTELCVDKRLFMCVLRNIVNNAVVHGQATEVKFKVDRSDQHCELEVSDNGKGEQPNSKGHGLGLNLCAQLLEKMQGEFKVLSTRPFVVSLWIPVPK